MRNKATIYSYYILENDLDIIIIITETWLNDQGDESVIRELVPAGYSYVSRNRKNLEGGGIIIIYKETLQIKLQKNESYTSFESIEVTCKIYKTNSQLLRIFGIYRPPPSVKNKLTVNQFLSEFQDFLIEKTLLPSQAIFAGDFNFHVGDVNNNFSNKFLGMTESFNLYQQVREITHEKGHILDFVLANNDGQTFKISNMRVEQCGISDHHIVLFDLNVDKPRPLHKTINYGHTKSIDIPAFINNIKNSGLTNEVSKSATVSEKFDKFNRFMNNILDIHGPFKTKNDVCRPNTRWFNREISQAKKTQREAERTWRNSKLEVHRQIFVETRNKIHKLIVRTKKNHQ